MVFCGFLCFFVFFVLFYVCVFVLLCWFFLLFLVSFFSFFLSFVLFFIFCLFFVAVSASFSFLLVSFSLLGEKGNRVDGLGKKKEVRESERKGKKVERTSILGNQKVAGHGRCEMVIVQSVFDAAVRCSIL